MVVKLMFLLLMIWLGLNFYMNLNPVIGCLLMVMMSLISMIYISLMGFKWMSYLLILLFLGGVMILFIYVCSMTNKSKMFFKKINVKYYLVSMAILSFYIYPLTPLKTTSVASIFTSFSNNLLFFLIFYLLFMLIAVVKISKKNSGSLKAKMYE